ncbi:MAG TPA: response regulator transcription factor [Anaerolineae bacterium]|nr:response regulator transcription factor [Anaerolineae bacterium]HMR66937.1 response regulator transcription factor [Anaerolineae bacterium]
MEEDTRDPIRVLIADDHPLFRDGVRALLNSLPAAQVVGEAATGAEAVAQAEALQPDVILMDILMPDLNGIEATRQILGQNPTIGILMLTMFEDDESVFAAMRVGARGYILKGADQVEIWHAIQAVARGEALFGPAIARRLINFFSRASIPTHPFPELTEREHEILSLMAQGYSNAEIAETFVLSPKTVRNHVSNIFSKLQVADRAHAIVKAREAGLG